MNLQSKQASAKGYEKQKYDQQSILESVYHFIISRFIDKKRTTRKDVVDFVVNTLEKSPKNEARVSELLNHGYIYQKIGIDGYNDIYPVNIDKKLNPADFSDKSNKNVDPAVKYGTVFGINLFKVILDENLSNEDKNKLFKEMISGLREDATIKDKTFKKSMSKVNMVKEELIKNIKIDSLTEYHKVLYSIPNTVENFLPISDLQDVIMFVEMNMKSTAEENYEKWKLDYPHLIKGE